MKIITAENVLDVNVVRAFLRRYGNTMPELKSLGGNLPALNGIVTLFQAFANNTERLNSFFTSFKTFLAQYDATKENETTETTTTQKTKVSNGIVPAVGVK